MVAGLMSFDAVTFRRKRNEGCHCHFTLDVTPHSHVSAIQVTLPLAEHNFWIFFPL